MNKNLLKREDGSLVINEGELINKAELMKWLKVSRSTVQAWQRKGMPHTRFQNFIAYDKQEVTDWLDKNNYGPVELIAKWNKQKMEGK